MSLDPQQQAVVDAPVDANLLVQAGPGSGKTHVLVSRIQALVDGGRCAPGETLVLSFSKAARDELATRISRLPADSYAHGVTLRTIDSFATSVLFDGRGGAEGDYQDRIIAATEDIRDDAFATKVSQYRHVLIDEAQDIVGVRGDMIMALMMALPEAGFTVFADSAQAIYDFSIEDDPTQMRSEEWLNVLADRALPTPCAVHRLMHYYRSSVPEIANFCRQPWAKLVERQHDEAGSQIDAMVRSLPSAGSLDRLTWPPAPGRSRLVVCPNNGQVLYAASRCMAAGVHVRVERGETDWAHPAWIGRLLIGLRPTQEISLPFLSSQLSARLPQGVSAGEVHDALRFACRTGRGSPRVSQVVLALNNGVKFPSLLPPDSTDRITFSSIHRSKGREFDEVAFLDYSDWDMEQRQPTEGYHHRVRFVGLSRARHKLWSIAASDRPKVMRARKTGRWVGVWFGGRGPRAQAIEVGDLRDVDAASFVRADAAESAMARQDRIQQIRRGDEVNLVRGAGHDAVYDIVLVGSGERLGSMSHAFSDSLAASIKGVQGWIKVMPSSISGCWVRGINTAVPSEIADMQGVPSVISEGRLWNFLVIEGLGKLNWPAQND